MKKVFFCLFLLICFIIPISYQDAETTTRAIDTPFEARYIDIDNSSVLYAIDYNGTVWSYNTTKPGASWNLELVTSNTTYNQYNTLWISPYWNYSVYVAVSMTGIWKKNSTGWIKVNNYGDNNIPHLPWHWTENPTNGALYLQSHAETIYNSTDGGDTWNIFYNMTASDNTYYSGEIDDHFHAIAFDNETQSLWASTGDTRDTLRRYNNSGNWEIVGIDAPSLGGLGNIYQPTSITFDETYAYFGCDASTKIFRINKTISSSELPLTPTNLEVEIILTLDEYPYPDNQWVFENRYIDGVLYMPTCYNDGILLTSINGVEWINVFKSNGYFLPGLGSPSDDRATWKGGISSMTHRAPIYFVHNMKVRKLNLNTDDFKHLYNEPFITDDNDGTLIINRAVTSGSGYIGLGENFLFTRINSSLVGLSVYQNIRNGTFEFGANESWTEEGYGTISVVSDDKHSGTYSLKQEIPNGTSGSSLVFPPNCKGIAPGDYGIPTKGLGQYFFSAWLKTNVTWTQDGTTQPKFYLSIVYLNTLGVETHSHLRINITTSWVQQFFSVFLPANTFQIRPYINIYRENNTERAVWIDDVMFWGAIRYSYVDSTRQYFISPAFTNSWGTTETMRDTENITITIGGIDATFQNVLTNGTEITLGSITSEDVTYKNIIPYTTTVQNSSQVLLKMIVTYKATWLVPIMPLMGLGGFVLIGIGGFYVARKVRERDILESIRALLWAIMVVLIGVGLIIGWLWA